jgi:predicted  nucleic acid-binding Zn-ribbon protein
VTFENRRAQEEEVQTLLDKLRNEYDSRRTLGESIDQQIQKLEGKGDSQMIQVFKAIRQYQQSLNASRVT